MSQCSSISQTLLHIESLYLELEDILHDLDQDFTKEKLEQAKHLRSTIIQQTNLLEQQIKHTKERLKLLNFEFQVSLYQKESNLPKWAANIEQNRSVLMQK